MSEKFDVIVIGAGAAGLMCAAEAGKRGRRVLVVDHAKKPGRKILNLLVAAAVTSRTMMFQPTTSYVTTLTS